MICYVEVITNSIFFSLWQIYTIWQLTGLQATSILWIILYIRSLYATLMEQCVWPWLILIFIIPWQLLWIPVWGKMFRNIKYLFNIIFIFPCEKEKNGYCSYFSLGMNGCSLKLNKICIDLNKKLPDSLSLSIHLYPSFYIKYKRKRWYGRIYLTGHIQSSKQLDWSL